MDITRKGTNASAMKDGNVRLVLNMIRRERLSRADIAKRTGLTRATISILTDELIRRGYVLEEPDGEYSGVGRRPLILTLCETSVSAMGIALDRKGYQIGIYDLSGRERASLRGEYLGSAEESIDTIAERATELIRNNNIDNVIGIGVTSPGPVDYKNGRILNPPAFKAFHGCEIRDLLSERTGLPIFLENISNAEAISQKYFGSCRDEENYAYILVEDGIGSGIVVGGDIYRGQNGYGNELGHTSIAFDGIECECGNRGCLERYASIPALISGTPYKSWEDASYDSGTVAREAGYLTAALTNLINLFDLDKIVLGGDVSTRGDELAEAVSDGLARRIITQRSLPVVTDSPRHSRALAGGAIALHNLIF